MALGFLSPILPTLQSNDSPFHGRPITLTELSWVGSCYAIGTILGNFVFSPLASIIGQKRAVALIAIPNLVSQFFLNLIEFMRYTKCFDEWLQHVFVGIFVVYAYVKHIVCLELNLNYFLWYVGSVDFVFAILLIRECQSNSNVHSVSRWRATHHSTT